MSSGFAWTTVKGELVASPVIGKVTIEIMLNDF
jgi:hypothetical protein